MCYTQTMEITHGTMNTYTNYGCRCEECKAAASEYNRELRKRRSGTLSDDDERHGTTSAYTGYGCRCEKCRRAWADYNAKARDRRRSALSASMAQSRNGFRS